MGRVWGRMRSHLGPQNRVQTCRLPCGCACSISACGTEFLAEAACVLHLQGGTTMPRIKTQMHRPTGEQDIRDRQNSGDCDGQLEVEWRIREDQSNADSMPRPPIRAQVTAG